MAANRSSGPGFSMLRTADFELHKVCATPLEMLCEPAFLTRSLMRMHPGLSPKGAN